MKHRAESLQNLIYTIYAKGALMSKSTGGRFYVSDDLVKKLQEDKTILMEDVIRIISEAGEEDLAGVTITGEDVTFNLIAERRIVIWTTK